MECAMPSFHNGDVQIAYLDEGEGEPILLVHGFASTKNVNWVYPAWVSELKKAGRRVIALDNPGDGRRCRRADGPPRTRARRCHGLFARRANDGLACAA